MLINKIWKVKLEIKFLDNIEINSKELSLINDYSEIIDALKMFPNEKILNIKFLYLNRTNIKMILAERDEIIKIKEVDVTNNNYIVYFFYLFSIITDDIYNINYSYDFYIVKELYNRMIDEKKNIRKFILYILAYPIVYNYEGIDESNSSEELEKIYNEIDEFIKKQKPILEKYNLNLDLYNYKSFNIDDVYCQIIISLIRNEKLKNFNEAKDIMEQLDLGNIELTHDMYINLKKEFDENSNKKYIVQYKIVYSDNIKNFINEDLINFYFILLIYVFKNEIYIYNIDFLLENRKCLLKIFKNNYEKLFSTIDNIKNDEYKEKIIYVLKKFLDSSYNYIDKANKIKMLREIYTYYKNYCFESKKTDILKINDFLKNNKELKEVNKYIQDFNLAKKMNIIFPFVKYLFDYDETNGIDEAKLNSYIKELDEIEQKLTEKKELDNDNQMIKLFKFFDTKKNVNEFIHIFNKDAFNFLMKLKSEAKNEILNYYNDFFLESKNKELVNFDDYSKAKQTNKTKCLISLLINDKKLQIAMKKWNKIETDFKNKNFKNIEKEVLVKLINLCNDENKELIKDIFSNEQIEVFLKDEFIKNIEKEIKKLIFFSISYLRKNDDESDEEFEIIIEHNKNGKKLGVPKNVLGSERFMNFFEKRNNNNEKNEEMESYSIFHFLIDIRDGLIKKYNNKIEFIIEIFELEFDGTNNRCEYKIFKINDESEPIFKGTINISSESANKIIHIINNLTKNEKEKNEKDNAITTIKWDYDEDDYKILSFIKVIGDHNEIGGTYTAEFIKELNGDDIKFISIGSDKTLRFYSGNFYEKNEIRITSNDIVYNIYQKPDKKLQIFACTNKGVILYKKEEGVFKDSFLPLEDDNMSYISLLEIKNKEKEMIIIAGKGGILCINNLFNEKIKYDKVKILNDCEYRGLIQIDENLIAFTSNKILSRGENILVVYDLSNNNIIYKKKASFITTTNGLTVLFPATEEDSTNEIREKYLICACKKYEEDQENGIMMIRIKDKKIDDKECIFIPTKDFEVYCFCQIFDKIINKKMTINETKADTQRSQDLTHSNQDLCKSTDFFLVGGFDNIRREGLIKLYKLNKEGKGIKFLQDIEFEKYDLPNKKTETQNQNQILKNKLNDETRTKTDKVDLNATLSDIEFKNNNIELSEQNPETFMGFNGAISSIIQSKSTFNILVSCYDGKVSKLSTPNLVMYGQNLNY